MVYMEDMGFSVVDMFQNQKIFSLATAFAGVCAQCTREEAEHLLEQHILGGGSLEELYTVFMEMVNQSGFFKKFLKQEE